VYDHGPGRFVWANDAALELWRASDREEFLSRDLSNTSDAARARIDNSLRIAEGGGTVKEDWTFYPRDVPTTVTIHSSGVRLDDGRLALLGQAIAKGCTLDPTMVRGVEAVRHSTVMVSLLEESGERLFDNPAALRAFGGSAPLEGRFADPNIATELREAVGQGKVYTAEVEARTALGARFHLIEARSTVDPVGGGRAVLIHHTDVTERRNAEERAEAQQFMIDELGRSLALVDEQRRQILALSAPILEVGRRTLAVPLIGRFDAGRHAELSRRLLPEVVARGATCVIIDLTGAELTDAASVAPLITIVGALRMLGARAVVSGIRPDLAASLSSLELQLDDVTIARSLRQAIELCARSDGRGQPRT
jgi:rsbT co-antagonist protein RsbR